MVLACSLSASEARGDVADGAVRVEVETGALALQHAFSGRDAARLRDVVEVLEPHVATIQRAFGLPAGVVHAELREHPHCAQLNRDPFVVRPAFVEASDRGVVYLCGPFFRRSREEAAVVLGHELLHVQGLDDDLGGTVSHQEGSRAITARVREIVRRKPH